MIQNEPLQESLQAVKEKVFEQNGLKVVSCVFIGICTVDGKIPGPGMEFKIITLTDIPEGLNNAQHDLTMLGNFLGFVIGREAQRCGGGPVRREPNA